MIEGAGTENSGCALSLVMLVAIWCCLAKWFRTPLRLIGVALTFVLLFPPVLVAGFSARKRFGGWRPILSDFKGTRQLEEHLVEDYEYSIYFSLLVVQILAVLAVGGILTAILRKWRKPQTP